MRMFGDVLLLVISVSMKPGAIMLTVTELPRKVATSFASDLVKPTARRRIQTMQRDMIIIVEESWLVWLSKRVG